MPRAYDLAIFDFDGVLADSAPWVLRNATPLLARHGLPGLGEAELQALRSVSNREIIRRLKVPWWRLPGMARDMRALMAANAASIPLFEGVPAFLAALDAAGLKIAVVSSNAETTIRGILGPAATAHVTRFACGAGLFGKPAIFRKVIRALGVSPSRVLAVGDETRDVEAARKAGVACAAVTWGYATPDALAAAGPDHMPGSYEELQALLTS